jgi:leucyl aminopeptidase
MNLTFSSSSAEAVEAGVLGVLITDVNTLPEAASALDAALAGALTRELAKGRLRESKGDVVSVTGGESGPERVVLIGLGSAHDGREESVRVAGAKLASAMKAARSTSAALLAADDSRDTELLVEGFSIGSYKYDKFKSKGDDGSDDKPDATLTVVNGDSVKAQVEQVCALVQAVNWARDLANAPGNHMKPVQLAAEAAAMADEFEHMTCTTLDRAAIEKAGMGLLAGVAQGSVNEPRLIVLEWNPPSAKSMEDDERIALVGKAVTFDTGGISIKPSMGMTEMKLDKSGGCAVLGAMRAIAQLDVPKRVLAVVGSTENMPDGNAYKPGDVITAMDGTTIEITNTDAEGRLVLGDAICYAREKGCAKIVELSTLTGAMVISLGHHFTGAIARNGEWTDAVLASSQRTGDHAWHLPLHDAYKPNLKSECADMVNSGGRAGGSLYAGLFLEHFAKDTPFVHLDVAGTAMLPKPSGYYLAKGASGWGVRLLTDLVASS